jgi:hypothetical protein
MTIVKTMENLIIGAFIVGGALGGILYLTSQPAPDRAVAQVSDSKCRTEDIELGQITWHPGRNNSVDIAGEFTNHCQKPTGVQLAFIFRDAKGVVLKVAETFPASSANIPSGKSFAFYYSTSVIDPASMATEVRAVYFM